MKSALRAGVTESVQPAMALARTRT